MGVYDYSSHGDNWQEGAGKELQSPVVLSKDSLYGLDGLDGLEEKNAPKSQDFHVELRPARMFPFPTVQVSFTATGANVNGECLKDNQMIINGKTLHLANIHFHRKAEHVLDRFQHLENLDTATSTSPSLLTPLGSPMGENPQEAKSDDPDCYQREGLEVHCVFDDDTNTHAAVMGVVFVAGPNKNAFLDSINWPKSGDHDSEWRIGERGFVHQLLGSTPPFKFMHYSGSLTTPPCTEGILWFVSESVATVEQMRTFDHLLSDASHKTGNFRHCQQLNGRKPHLVSLACHPGDAHTNAGKKMWHSVFGHRHQEAQAKEVREANANEAKEMAKEMEDLAKEVIEESGDGKENVTK